MINAYERMMQPTLTAWLEFYSDRAAQLTDEEIDELYSLNGVGGPLTTTGIEHFVDRIERRRALVEKIAVLSGTDLFGTLEVLVDQMLAQVQPFAGRTGKPEKSGDRKVP